MTRTQTYTETSASGRELMPREISDIKTKHGAEAAAIIEMASNATRLAGGRADYTMEARLSAAKRHVRVGQIFETSKGDWLRMRGAWVRIA